MTSPSTTSCACELCRDEAEIDRKASAKSTAVSERQQYDSLELDAGTKRDALATATDKLQQAQYKLEKLEGEEKTLDARRVDVRANLVQS